RPAQLLEFWPKPRGLSLSELLGLPGARQTQRSSDRRSVRGGGGGGRRIPDCERRHRGHQRPGRGRTIRQRPLLARGVRSGLRNLGDLRLVRFGRLSPGPRSGLASQPDLPHSWLDFELSAAAGPTRGSAVVSVYRLLRHGGRCASGALVDIEPARLEPAKPVGAAVTIAWEAER